MGKKNRIIPVTPSTGRRFSPPPTEPIQYNKLKPIFSLEFMKYRKRHCLSGCTGQEKAAFADQILQISQLTWEHIASVGRHQLGFETIKRKSIKAAIPPDITEDVTFIAFRCIGKKPMVGYRDRNVFYVIWIDRNADVYDH